MANLKEYRDRVRKVIEHYAEGQPLPEGVERQFIFDTEHDHYQLVNVGWDDKHWIYGCVMHIDIKDGKVWLQYNGTEVEMGDELVAAGIPEKDIVIGFHSPFTRQFTKYSAG